MRKMDKLIVVKEKRTGILRRVPKSLADKAIEQNPKDLTYSTKGAYKAQQKTVTKFSNRPKRPDNPFMSKQLANKAMGEARREAKLKKIKDIEYQYSRYRERMNMLGL